MIEYVPLNTEHFNAVISLGNAVHGNNYLDDDSIHQIYQNSWQNQINCSWVAIDKSVDHQKAPEQRFVKEGLLIGFRLTLAASKWQVDKWCTPNLWGFLPDDVCYFKCNTVDEDYRAKGLGKSLLMRSIKTAEQQGAKAGLAHIWLASPNNSAHGYFSACGGKLIKKHPNKWQVHSIEDNYLCPICGDMCQCTAAEMLLSFAERA